MHDARDLRRSFWIVTVTAGLITALGLVFILFKAERDARDAVAERNAKIEVLAASLQDAVRDVAATNAAGRIAALRTWADAGGSGRVAGRFAWEYRKGVVWQENVPPRLVAVLGGFTQWNNWKALGKREPKRGLLVPDPLPGTSVLWARLGSWVYAVAYDGTPVPETSPRAGLVPCAVAMLLLLAVGVIPGLLVLRRAAAEARAEEARAREEDAKKTAFVSNASHELKTPLAAIAIWASLLQSGRLAPEKLRRAYDVIAEENARMTRLVENLLDFSRLEQGRRKYRTDPVDLVKAARGVVELAAGQFAHGISTTGASSCFVSADADAVKQILVNLVGNAAKYAADAGPVEVVVRADGDRGVVDVADRGPGLSAEERGRVFERFYRVAAVSGAGGGLGLGLSISLALAHGMGGGLSVSARDGGGCVFTLSLPLFRQGAGA